MVHGVLDVSNLLLVHTPSMVNKKHHLIDTLYREEKKGLNILLSYSQAGQGRNTKQGQEEISRNHIQTIFLISEISK